VNLGTGRLTPDGTYVVGSKGKAKLLFPLAGGEPVLLPGLEPGEAITSFEPDSRAAFVCDGLNLPVAVFRVDPTSGRLTPTGPLVTVPAPVAAVFVPVP
jgi:hypothetical protein